jgi:hypothetical protein
VLYFVNLILMGQVSSNMAAYLNRQHCTALQSPTKIRFVGSDSGLLKLASRVAIMTFLKPMKESLRLTNEYAVTKKNGAHSVVIAAQSLVDTAREQSDVSAALLAVDASKAYHCVDRRKLRAAVEAKFPAALPLLDLVLTTSRNWGMSADGRVVSAEMVNGFGQGKVLSGLLFTFYMWSVVVPTSGIPTDQLGHLSTYMDDCFVIGHVDSVLKIGDKLMRAMVNSGLQVQHKKTKLYMPAATQEQATQHAAKLSVSSLGGAGGASAKNGIVVLGMPVGSKTYISNWLVHKAKTISDDMKEVAQHCSEQTIYHMLKSIVSKNNYLVSCIPNELTKHYASTVDGALSKLTASLFYPDRTARNRLLTSKSVPGATLSAIQVLLLRAHLPHRMQGLGILLSSPRRGICYAKAVAATLGTNLKVSDHAYCAMLDVAARHGIIPQAELDAQDGDNLNRALGERARKGLEATTVRTEMEKKLTIDHETFRDYASVDMLAAADRYDSGTTQVLIARPNRSQTRIAGEAFRLWLAIVMGFKAPQTAGVKFKADGSAVRCTACKGGHQLRDNHLVSCPCFRVVTHTKIVDVVCDMLADAGMGFKKEEANHNLDNNQRPDVMAANIVDGKSNRSQMAIDVSVANTLSAHRQDSQEKEIKKREKSKHTKYYDLGRAEDAVIVPAVVTSYGALGSDFKTLINKTKEEALRRGRYVPGLDPDFIPYWTQNIVCTAVKFLSLAAKRAVTHQREHHHGYTAPPHG